MIKSNGGIIGPDNVTTGGAFGTASGVFKLGEATDLINESKWPTAGPQGFQVANSARFNSGSSDRLIRTQTAGNRRTFTISWWMKRSGLTAGTQVIGSDPDGSAGNNFAILDLKNTDALDFSGYESGHTFRLITNRLFRDVSAWMHIVFAVDTTQGTAANRMKIYVNGVQETSFSTENYPSQNYETKFNENSNVITVGGRSGSYFNGYMAEVCMIDGQALAPTSFGEFNSQTGIWVPKSVTGLTFGTNGFYQNYSNSGALGEDFSGEDNDFTVNNLTSLDQSTDTCSTNFATLNPLFPAGGTLTFSEGNTSISAPNDGNWKTTLSTISSQNGKWYMEFKSGGNYVMAGVCDFNVTSRGIDGDNFATKTTISAYGYGYYNGDGSVRYEGGTEISNYGATYGDGDIIGIALDCDNDKLYFSKNGVFQNSGDPTSGSTGTGAVSLNSTAGRSWGFAFSIYQTNNRFANFGSPSFAISSGNADQNGFGNFEYAPPAGYLSLNTKNLAAVLG